MQEIVALARRSVEEFVKTGKAPALSASLPADMQAKAGVFVCLKKRGELRGCIGTFLPCCDTIAAETARNAIAAATQDPRFPAVAEDELDELSYSVDVLSPPEKVNDIGELDPREFGVIVSCGNRRGLLLPDLEGVDTVEEQLRITRMKAGIMPDEEVEIFRFRVTRYR
jgi:AmmeMemoRadiSam system protein A